jgi:hypothetical protein
MPRNVSPLNPAPVPLRTADHILVNECDGNWEYAPNPMIHWVTPAIMQCLGRLYDWKYIRGYDDSVVPQKMLKTNDSVLAPLRQKNLIRRHRNSYYYITGMGRRVYELNYWRNLHYIEARREQMRERTAARRQFMYGNSLTEKVPRRLR